MRTREQCTKQAKAFLQEMIAADKPLRKPDANEQARQWCKVRRYAEYKFGGPSGWIITRKGRSKIEGGLPL